MVTLEQVERLRDKANVSFEDAKQALEASNGDLLDAIIYLEKNGKVGAPAGGGYYSSGDTSLVEKKAAAGGGGQKKKESHGESFGDMLRRFGRFCGSILEKGNTNDLEATRAGRTIFSLPVTVVVVLLLFLFWVVVPLFIVSLFFGFRYRFRGSDLDRESVNRVMDGASDAADGIKRSFGGQGK